MNQLHPSFSEFAKKSQLPSPVNEMTERFALDFREGIDINLGVGYVNDETIPAEKIKEAMAAVLADNKTYRNALNYGGAEGSPALRSAIKNYYLHNNIGSLTETDFNDIQINIGANGATSILDSFAEIIEPGIVITADPYYYIYCDTLQRKGFDVITIPEDNDGIRIDLLKKKLAEIDIKSLRFFYIVTVNNPTCTIINNKRKEEIVKLAEEISQEEQRLIPVIFDKAYEDIIHNPAIEPPVSGLKFETQQIVFEIGTFSKVIAPALRIGYVLTRNKEFAKLISQKVSDIGFSAPLITEEITAWMLDNHIMQQLETVKKGYREKAEELKKYIVETIGSDLTDIKGGDAGFYFYLTLKVDTHKESIFYKFLNRITGQARIDGFTEINQRLVYIPGAFCVNPFGDLKETGKKQLRISYGFETVERVKRAIDLIKEAIEFSKNEFRCI